MNQKHILIEFRELEFERERLTELAFCPLLAPGSASLHLLAFDTVTLFIADKTLPEDSQILNRRWNQRVDERLPKYKQILCSPWTGEETLNWSASSHHRI